MLLNEMELFYYVVKLQSFSKAAEKLETSKSSISKRLNKLEEDLKVRLLTRSTRKLSLTEAGEAFYQQCLKVLTEAELAYSLISSLNEIPSGTLKVSAPPALATHVLAPIFAKFSKQYPEVLLDIDLSNQLSDLIKDGYDLAIRSARLQSSNLIVQELMGFSSIICATPRYLKEHGTPTTPKQLAQHAFALYSGSKEARRLKLYRNSKEEVIELEMAFLANHLELNKKMMLSDICMTVLPHFMVEDEIKKGKIVACLSNYHLADNVLYLLYPEKQHMPPKLRVFIEMLKKELS